jgi:hypothetical protein
MMNTPRLAAQFLAFALFDIAQLAARSFINLRIRLQPGASAGAFVRFPLR